MWFSALLLLSASCTAAQIFEEKFNKIPFKSWRKYTYEYKTTTKVLNPLLPSKFTSVKLKAWVDLFFLPHQTKLNVILKIREPEFTYVTTPKLSTVPVETKAVIEEELKLKLAQPIQFIYQEGKVMHLKVVGNVPLWIINLQKGLISMLQLDVSGFLHHTRKPMYSKPEVTIQGHCKSIYTIKKVGQFLNVVKLIDASTCTKAAKTLWTNVVPEVESKKEEPALKSLTTMKYKVFKTGSNFKIMCVHAVGAVNLQPFMDSTDTIASVGEQVLTLFEESSMGQAPFIAGAFIPEPVIIKAPELMKITPSLDVLTRRIKLFLQELIMNIKETDVPLTKEIAEKMLQFVHALRPLNLAGITHVWDGIMEISEVEMKKWFIHLLALVKTEPIVKLVYDKIKLHTNLMPKDLLQEFLFLIGSTPFATKQMLDHMERFCRLPVVIQNKPLLHTCLVAHITMKKTYCSAMPYCKVKVPEILMKTLMMMTKPQALRHLTEEEMLNYLVLAETAEAPILLRPILRIIHNKNLPLQVQVRAIFALRPLTRILRNRVIIPLLKLFKTYTMPEEVRLAAFTVMIENPTPSVLLTCVPIMKVEPSLTVQRFIYDALLSFDTFGVTWPIEIKNAATTARKTIVTLRLIPVGPRWLRMHLLKIIKSPMEKMPLIMSNIIQYVPQSIIPRRIMTKMDIPMFGKQFSLFNMDLRLEGVQELITKLFGIFPTAEKWLTMPIKEKIINFTEKLATKPITPEELKLFLDIKLFGKHWNTFYTSESSAENFFSGKILNFMNLLKALDKGYELELVKPIMPVEVMLSLPMCNGITLVHELRTFALIHVKTLVKLQATPSLWGWEALMHKTVPRSIDTAFELKHKHTIVMKASAHFELPIAKWGLTLTFSTVSKVKARVQLHLNLKTQRYQTEIDLPKVKEVMKTESEFEHFLDLLTTPKRIKEPITPVEVMPHLKFIKSIPSLRDTAEEVRLQVAPGKFLSTISKNVVISETPVKWTVIRHGKTGLIITLYLPEVGFLYVHPKTKTITISPSTPTYWLAEYVTMETFKLKTLLPTMTNELPSNFIGKLPELFEFISIFRKQEIVIEGMEDVYSMVEGNYLPHKVAVMNLAIVNDIPTVSETQFSLMKIKIQVPVTTKIKEFVMKEENCYGKLICMYGYHPTWHTWSLLKSVITPAFFTLKAPAEEMLKKIIFRHETFERLYESTSISEMGLSEIVSERSLLVTSKLIKPANKLSIKLFANNLTIACADVKYHKNGVMAEASLSPNCAVKHLTFKLVLPPMLPRYWFELQWTANFASLPSTLLWKILKIKDLIILPILRLPRFLMDPLLMTEEHRHLTEPIDVWKLKTLKGAFKVYLATPKLADLELRTPLFKFFYKLPLPVSIEKVPVGTMHYPLVQKLSTILQPVCYLGPNMVKTFDEVKYMYNIAHFKCEHVLMQSCSTSLPTFMVMVKPMHNWRMIRIVIPGAEIKFIPISTNKTTVMINEQLIALENDIFTTELPSKFKIQILFERKLNRMVFYNYELGLEVALTAGKLVEAKISSLMFARVCGLCGNMNGEPRDEFMTPRQKLVLDPALFGMSWMIHGEDCTDKCPIKLTKDITVTPTESHVCKPTVPIPVCKHRCTPIKTIKLKEVPCWCNGKNKKVPVVVPTECHCPHCITV